MKSRKVSWINSWRWYVLFQIFVDYLWSQRRLLYRALFLSTAIVIGVELSYFSDETVRVIQASLGEYEVRKVRLKQEEEERLRQHAEEVERQYQMQQQSLKYAEYTKWQAHQQVLEELHKNFGIGDFILITWWGELKYGPDPPENNLPAGQITHFDNLKVYGTWGDYPLDYPHAVFERCRKREMLDAQDKWLKKLNKNNKVRKKFESWGIYPGTVTSK